jgi:hypothetical protein
VVTRAALLAIAYASILIAIVAVRPHATPGPFLRDVEAYWSAGSTWNASRDAYGRGIWQAERAVPGVNASRDEVLPFAGPPPVLLIWSLLARLPYPAAARLWSAVLIGAVALLAGLALRAARIRLAPLPFAIAIALAVAFGPLTSDLALGQIALLACAAALAAATLAESRTAVASAAACVAMTQPNAAFGLVSQIGRNRTTVALAAGIVAAYALGAFAAGPAWPLEYARALAAHASAERFIAIQFDPAAIAFGAGAPAPVATAFGIAAILAALAALVALVLRVPDRLARFAACSALTPFVAGFFHEHDLVVAYPAAIWCATRTRGATRTAGLAGTLLVAVDWLGFAQRPSGIAQSAFLALAACAAFAAFSDDRHRPAMSVLSVFAVLFALAAWLGATHPAPVWPDALGAFHAPAAAPIAQVWAAEQRASGLAVAEPAWALLRALPLIGCALLAAAIYRRSACHRTA